MDKNKGKQSWYCTAWCANWLTWKVFFLVILSNISLALKLLLYRIINSLIPDRHIHWVKFIPTTAKSSAIKWTMLQWADFFFKLRICLFLLKVWCLWSCKHVAWCFFVARIKMWIFWVGNDNLWKNGWHLLLYWDCLLVCRLPDVGRQKFFRQSDTGGAGSRPPAPSRPDHGLTQSDCCSPGAAGQDHGDESAVPAVRQVELHVSETNRGILFIRRTHQHWPSQ